MVQIKLKKYGVALVMCGKHTTLAIISKCEHLFMPFKKIILEHQP